MSPEREKRKSLIESEMKRLDKNRILAAMERRGWKDYTVKTAIVRGSISKDMSFDLEACTQIDAKFWQAAERYTTKGVLR